jgi:hypothetical protein
MCGTCGFRAALALAQCGTALALDGRCSRDLGLRLLDSGTFGDDVG